MVLGTAGGPFPSIGASVTLTPEIAEPTELESHQKRPQQQTWQDGTWAEARVEELRELVLHSSEAAARRPQDNCVWSARWAYWTEQQPLQEM